MALKGITDDGFDEGSVARARHADADAEVQLQLRNEIEVKRRHDELLLLLYSGHGANRPTIAIIFERRRQPSEDSLVLDLALRRKRHPAMRSRPRKRFLEGKVRD